MIGRDPVISSEPGNISTVDFPDSWWRNHVHVAVWILVAGALLVFLRVAAEAIVPLVLGGMLFYALDPAVDGLERWRVPRALGAALALGLVLAGSVAITYSLRDDVATVITELPDAARRLRAALQTSDESSTLDSLRKATTELDKTAAEAAGRSAAAPRGVLRVQVEEPVVRVSDHVWSGSLGLVGLASQLAMVAFWRTFCCWLTTCSSESW